MFGGLFDIVFFALVAAFFAFKLYSVLGKRNDGEGTPEHLSKYWQTKAKEGMGNVVPLPVAGKPELAQLAEVKEEPAFSSAVPAHLIPVLTAIQQSDRQFTEAYFLKGVKMAFDMIVTAFSKGDKTALQSLLSKDTYQGFAEAIDGREASGERPDVTVVAILSCEIADATLTKGLASVTVKIVSEQITVVRNKEGEIVAGNPSQIDVIEDSWTFARKLSSANPNWELVATTH